MRTGIPFAIRMIFFLIVASFLQGCADVAITGAQAVYNHHSIQKNLNDQYINFQAFNALNKDPRFKSANISVATFNREVLLAGQAPKRWQRMEAERLIKKIPDVKRVYNLVSVSMPSSTLKRISDTWLTAKVKAKLIASNDVDATQIKVVTENGTVFLMGTLLPSQAEAAVDMARTTEGVERVVKIFTYMRLSKT
ncbi:BON domain-containing protein [Aquicella lusitana]|uniref:Osmotically-inducible protein OsmY n=1 Tax=Aquicella lusitana TaxID=254246 RepID=A0A370GMG0_9COXI|nr:BON domain-containing protein [Aquicella lusitana]RDI44560.1 osmotically-inducible protein OsmY [Aquicella lusitana]VVC72498.1 Osmotically-inducible protein Y [Aquicella lusitana]